MNTILNKVAKLVTPYPLQTGVVCVNWGVSTTETTNRPSTITDGLPPTKVYANGVIDLEFGPLLLVDFLVMDSAAFDTCVSSRVAAYARLSETLQALRDSGFIKLENYGGILNPSKQAILNASAAEASNPIPWLPAIRESVLGWERTRGVFEAASQDGARELMLHIPHGISVHLLESKEGLSADGYDRVRRLLFAKKARYTAREREVIGACIKPYLHHVLSYAAIRGHLSLPLFDWNDLRPLYVPLYRGIEAANPAADREQEKIRELFSTLLPSFEPTGYKQLLKLLKDSRIQELRNFIRTATSEGHRFSAADHQRIIEEIYRTNVRMSSIGTYLNGLGLAAGIGTTIAGVGPVGSILQAASYAGAQEVAQNTFSNFMEQNLSWLYLLLDHQHK